MKVYLDMCSIQRPLDTPNQIRIILEADAVLGLMSLIDKGQIELISSDALFYEANQITLPIRYEHTMAILEKAKLTATIDEDVKKGATEFMDCGLKTLDALHLALAEKAKADYFCTVDDGIFRVTKKINDLLVKVVNPVDLVQEIDK